MIAEPFESPADPVLTAVRRAAAHVRALQRPDGSWDYPCDFGVSTTAQAMIALRTLGRLDDELEARLLRSIARAQRSDGGFEGYPGSGTSDVGATASVVAALSCPSIRGCDATRTRAERWFFAHGGFEALTAAFFRGDVALLFAVAAGWAPADCLPFMPLSIWQTPGLARSLERFAHAGLSLLVGQIALLRKRHGGAWTDAGPTSWADRRAVRNLVALFDEIQNPSGSFVANTQFTSLAALALSAAGLPSTDRRIERAVGFVLASVERDADSASIPGNHSSVWSTALSLRALLHAGDRLETRLLDSLRWLLAVQASEPNALCNHRRPRAARCALRTAALAWLVDQQADDVGFVAYRRAHASAFRARAARLLSSPRHRADAAGRPELAA